MSETRTPLQEWTEVCKPALEACPSEFVSQFCEVMFAGQRLISRARIEAQIDAAKEAVVNAEKYV